MAQNLTASALNAVQAELLSVWGDGATTPSRYPWVEHTSSVRAAFANMNADPTPIIDQGTQQCIGYQVHWLKRGAATVDYSGAPGSWSPAVDIVSGQGAESANTTYTNNLIVSKTVEVDDNICGNLFRGGNGTAEQRAMRLITNQLQNAFYSIAKELNTRVINFFDSNKSAVNNDPSLPTGIAFGSSEFTVTESTLSMSEPDTLTELDAIAMNNDMAGYFYLCGRNHFYSARTNSQYRGANDNERDHLRFNDYEMYFDIKNLDSTLSGSNSFIVDPGAYIFWDHIAATTQITPTQVKDNSWEYYVEMPNLMINQGGILRPVRLNVYYQKDVDNVNTTEVRRTATHKWEVTFAGGEYVAPASEDNHTGILKFKSA